MKYHTVTGMTALSVLLYSCVIYRPQTIDIPLINQQNELRLDGGLSQGVIPDMTISYGISKNIAIQAYGSYTSFSYDIFIPRQNYYYQGAVGFYKHLNNENLLELYGGYGYGWGAALNDTNTGYLMGSYQVYFFQSDFGKISEGSSRLEYGVGLKTGLLHSNLLDNYYFHPLGQGNIGRNIDNSYLLEPGVFFRIGGERLKFNMRVAGCWIYQFTNTNMKIPYNFLNIGVSINYRYVKQ